MAEQKSSRAWLTIIAPKSHNGSQLHLYTLYKKGCSGWGILCLNAKWHRWRLFLGGFLKGAKIHKVTCQCLFKSHSSGDAELTLDKIFFPQRKKKKEMWVKVMQEKRWIILQNRPNDVGVSPSQRRCSRLDYPPGSTVLTSGMQTT